MLLGLRGRSIFRCILRVAPYVVVMKDVFVLLLLAVFGLGLVLGVVHFVLASLLWKDVHV